MDPNQFDEVVARLVSAASRRDAVKGVIGGTLASLGVTSIATSEGKDKKGKASADGKDKKGKASADGKGKRGKASADGNRRNANGNKKEKCSKAEKKTKVTICHKNQDRLTVSKCAYKKKHKKEGDPILAYGDPCPR